MQMQSVRLQHWWCGERFDVYVLLRVSVEPHRRCFTPYLWPRAEDAVS
jgi:hypothetical protein